MPQFPTPAANAEPGREQRIHSFADAKVLPPRAARRLVPRESLMGHLLEARRQRCVIVQGPAGCGKTTTLLAWRRELLVLGFDVAWLSLGAEDDELGRFFGCVMASLSSVDPSLAADVPIVLDRDSDELTVEHWVIALVQAVARRSREFMLLLDDQHHLQHPQILQALQWLLEYAPANLHLGLGSRSPIPLPSILARLRGQGMLAEFGNADLRFSASESERYLREHLGQIAPRDATALHELTDGWVAGLQLFALNLKGRSSTDILRMQVRDTSAFASYFEQEVLIRLEGDDLRLLLLASICERFCAALCCALLGQPHAVPRVLMRLARLDSEFFFISQVKGPDGEAWYRLHPLLREVLRTRMKQEPGCDCAALHAAARGWFDSRGYLDEAVRHAVLAGDIEAAADLVEQSSHELLAKGDLSHLSDLLRRLPPAQMDKRPGLQLVMAHLQLYARNFEAYRRIESSLLNDARLDADQRHILTVLRASCALHRDDTSAMRTLLGELRNMDTRDEFILSGRDNALAWWHIYEGQFEQARAVLTAAEHYAESPRRSLMGRCLLGLSHAIEGRITQAEHLFREVLKEADSYGVSYLLVSCMAAGLQALVLYEQGRDAAVCELLERRMKVLERIALPDTVLKAMAMLGMAHWRLGRHGDAMAWLDRLEKFALSGGLDRLLIYALFLKMRFQLRGRRGNGADDLIVRIREVAARHQDEDSGTSREVQWIALRSEVEYGLSKRAYPQLLDLLCQSVERARQVGRWRLVVILGVELGAVHLGLGDEVASRAALVEALRVAHRQGQMRTVLDAVANAEQMLAELLDSEALDPVLRFYVERLLSHGKAAASHGREDEQGAPLSRRELEVLHLVSQALPNKKIARVLNVSPETVKWHMKNIFYKLGVSGRDEAIARVRDLGLLQGGDLLPTPATEEH